MTGSSPGQLIQIDWQWVLSTTHVSSVSRNQCFGKLTLTNYKSLWRERLRDENERERESERVRATSGQRSQNRTEVSLSCATYLIRGISLTSLRFTRLRLWAGRNSRVFRVSVVGQPPLSRLGFNWFIILYCSACFKGQYDNTHGLLRPSPRVVISLLF